MSRIGKTIKDIRTKKGLTPKNLARKLGVAESFILDVESGRKIANESLLDRISKALGTDLHDSVSFYYDEEPKQQEHSPATVTRQTVNKKVNTTPTLPQWENAFSNIIKDIPVFDIQMQKALDIKKLPLIKNRIEGLPAEKLYYVAVSDNSMEGFRLKKDDIILIHETNDFTTTGLYHINIDGEKKIRQIKSLNKDSLLLISHDSSIHTKTATKQEIVILGRCIKAEIKL